ncbi:MAG: N-6 DNA methylase [Verrucomicrobia bacterium]|nr:N-6 DNA methylase [Verrucomicrobiota bacterium]
MPDRAQLTQFVQWCGQHITGDEKGEAQIFLDRLFQAFGQPGSLDVGGSPEFRVRKAGEDGGGTSFADFVWKPVVLVEMKKRGVELQKHYRQAFDYWTRITRGRPRYVVLCNFDEFRIYDFDTDLDTPKDTLALSDLPQRWGPLAFLAPGAPKPTFENDREVVTRQAADCLADCFKKLVKRGVPRETAQRFILQMLVALFAEDIDLLPKYFVTQLLDDCSTPASAYDLIGGLFEAMNMRNPPTGGRFKGVRYFNGGLFAAPARLEIQDLELVLLRKAATFDWSKVQPEIFGTLFQHSMGDDERHAFGAHFTHPSDIMKIVGPTIAAPWREQVESARTLKRLGELRERLHNFRVLDPACGSGNFLYIAYRELKRVEARIFERMETEFKSEAKQAAQMRLSFLSAQNFYGLDILPFAVEIAKVTMMIARKLAIDELHITEQPLPLDNLDQNFIAADALLTPEGLPTQWPKADVIIGNPPFLGAKLLKPERGPDYVNTLRRAYADVPGMADYCVYWFRKAHDHLPPCTASDPVAGRAGLVGTQNIRNNQSRVGGLDHVVKTGTIVEAVDNQPWSGEANVHVSIANWAKTQDAALLPKTRKLWFKVESSAGTKPLRKRGSGPASKEYELDFSECEQINSALSDELDVSDAQALACNTESQRCFTGQMIGHDSFLIELRQRTDLIKKSPNVADVTFPYLNGREFLSGDGELDRFVIDFGARDQLQAAAYLSAFDWVKTHVLPDRERKAKEGVDKDGNMRSHHKAFLARWWQLSFARPELISQVEKIGRFIVCSRVTKRPIFVFVSPAIRPGDALSCFTFEDDYSFGILHSNAHWLWFVAKCSKLKADFRYSPESVFDTFPWPQFDVGRLCESAQSVNDPPARRAGLQTMISKITAVADAARDVRRVRAEALPKLKGGLRALYRTLELPGANPLRDAHAALDAAVLAAYGFNAKKDLLAQLLALNQEVAGKIEQGAPVTAPGVPQGYPEPAKLVTEDCIGAKES